MDAGNGLSLNIGKYQKHLNIRLKELQDQNFVRRLWNKDADLWINQIDKTKADELAMGWLNVVEKMQENLPMMEEFRNEILQAGFKHVVLLGMGGSSLTPLVFQKVFAQNNQVQGLKLIVLDSTEPAAIKEIEQEIEISKTLFVVSSKSGTTAEVMAFYSYFFSRVREIKKKRAGENFIAITDPDTPLVVLAQRKKFKKIFLNFHDIGGRYSALSYFGILPAVLIGINVKELLSRAAAMVKACGPQVPASQNPGVILGAAIAQLALQGCDKLTYLMPSSFSTFGLWLEQLIAESTGKNGKGILPINGYPLIEMNTYGEDRIFFQMELENEGRNFVSQRINDFIYMDYPVLGIQIKDELDLGQEFFRWEIATITASSILGINPFDQPNVQESKKCTDNLLKAIEKNGELPEMRPSLLEDSLFYYSTYGANDAKSLLEKNFHLIRQGDYVSIQAYLAEDPVMKKEILEIKKILQRKLRVAVTTEFGPRYLHSTGQYYKGGPNTGVFIQFIGSSIPDILIPKRSYTFGVLKNAQAIGDMQALLKQNRRVILVDLGEKVISGLSSFKERLKDMNPVVYNGKKNKEEFNIPAALLGRENYTEANLNRATL